MKKTILYLLSLGCFACQAPMQQQVSDNSKIITPVDFTNVKITDSFWSPRLKKHVENTLPVCIDQIENQTGRMDNFVNAAKKSGEHLGIFFDDSDVYKALEGIAYSLINNPNTELEAKADEWIAKIASAQQPDGYINTFYTLTGLENRWKNMDKHEMYCAGHMTEAAIAYYKATGKRALLDVSIKMADHMMTLFGEGKRHWVAGHQEIELALVKLYEVTNQQKYLDFAYWLIDERGHGHGTHGDNSREWNKFYYQDDVPVRDMCDIAGHAVRAMYLYCGMADVAGYKNEDSYIVALNRLWNDVVYGNMYITGGIGSSAHNEGFTCDHDLPNYDAYCETCASIGMVYWNSRMNHFTGDSKYIDVLERSMYNGALAGVSLEGDRFFYVNPLASHGNHHRKAWYGCACCPSQLSRFLPSIGNYVYSTSEDAVWVNLYIENEAEFSVDNSNLKLTQTTNYPWDGNVTITIDSEKPLNKEFKLRIPDWCKEYTLAVNGEKVEFVSIEKGYAVLDKVWKSGDKISLSMEMEVEVMSADYRVAENVGKRAIQRGPLVYCVEEVDNSKDFDKIGITPATTFTPEFKQSMLGGVVTIEAKNSNDTALFIPYYSWDNREAGEMKVWVDYTK